MPVFLNILKSYQRCTKNDHFCLFLVQLLSSCGLVFESEISKLMKNIDFKIEKPFAYLAYLLPV